MDAHEAAEPLGPGRNDAPEPLIRLAAAGSELAFTIESDGLLLSAAADPRPVARIDGFEPKRLGDSVSVHTADGEWLLTVEAATRPAWRVVLQRSATSACVAWLVPRTWAAGGTISTAGGSRYSLRVSVLTGRWSVSRKGLGRLVTIRSARHRWRYELTVRRETAATDELLSVILVALWSVLVEPKGLLFPQ